MGVPRIGGHCSTVNLVESTLILKVDPTSPNLVGPMHSTQAEPYQLMQPK